MVTSIVDIRLPPKVNLYIIVKDAVLLILLFKRLFLVPAVPVRKNYIECCRSRRLLRTY